MPIGGRGALAGAGRAGIPFHHGPPLRHLVLELAAPQWLDLFVHGGDHPRAFWFSRTLRGSGSEEHAAAEECEAGAAVHGALEHLQLTDLPFGLRVAPERRQRRPNRRPSRGAPNEAP